MSFSKRVQVWALSFVDDFMDRFQPRSTLFLCGMYKVQGYKRCSHFIWYDDEISSRAKEIINTLQKKLDQERAKVDEANIKVPEVKTKLNSINLMMKFSVLITFVLAIGLVLSTVMK
ncbi:unnamed protein product [Vicia faba]|uniref:Uncharacterized protein n=1 Tax=Vicia faba TaxID=3906 RepID=A0AAV1AGR6_VICFA|nr:unnamed protein product [Vicia faba]